MPGALTRWDPYAELADLRSRFDRMFGDLRAEREWMPSIDVERSEGNLIMRADVPGIKPEELKIEVEDDVLTVSGSHEETSEEKKKDYVRRERRYGAFSRSLSLPAGVDAAGLTGARHVTDRTDRSARAWWPAGSAQRAGGDAGDPRPASDRPPGAASERTRAARSYARLDKRRGVNMAFQVGDRVVAESESTSRRPRAGVVEEVMRGEPSPRYRIRWEDGRESIYTPASGALRLHRRGGRSAPRARKGS
jgi:HSP20 family protein